MDLLPRYEKLPDISATQDELLFLAFLPLPLYLLQDEGCQISQSN